jgi:hypothetical protein
MLQTALFSSNVLFSCDTQSHTDTTSRASIQPSPDTRSAALPLDPAQALVKLKVIDRRGDLLRTIDQSPIIPSASVIKDVKKFLLTTLSAHSSCQTIAQLLFHEYETSRALQQPVEYFEIVGSAVPYLLLSMLPKLFRERFKDKKLVKYLCDTEGSFWKNLSALPNDYDIRSITPSASIKDLHRRTCLLLGHYIPFKSQRHAVTSSIDYIRSNNRLMVNFAHVKIAGLKDGNVDHILFSDEPTRSYLFRKDNLRIRIKASSLTEDASSIEISIESTPISTENKTPSLQALIDRGLKNIHIPHTEGIDHSGAIAMVSATVRGHSNLSPQQYPVLLKTFLDKFNQHYGWYKRTQEIIDLSVKNHHGSCLHAKIGITWQFTINNELYSDFITEYDCKLFRDLWIGVEDTSYFTTDLFIRFGRDHHLSGQQFSILLQMCGQLALSLNIKSIYNIQLRQVGSQILVRYAIHNSTFIEAPLKTITQDDLESLFNNKNAIGIPGYNADKYYQDISQFFALCLSGQVSEEPSPLDIVQHAAPFADIKNDLLNIFNENIEQSTASLSILCCIAIAVCIEPNDSNTKALLCTKLLPAALRHQGLHKDICEKIAKIYLYKLLPSSKHFLTHDLFERTASAKATPIAWWQAVIASANQQLVNISLSLLLKNIHNGSVFPTANELLWLSKTILHYQSTYAHQLLPLWEVILNKALPLYLSKHSAKILFNCCVEYQSTLSSKSASSTKTLTNCILSTPIQQLRHTPEYHYVIHKIFMPLFEPFTPTQESLKQRIVEVLTPTVLTTEKDTNKLNILSLVVNKYLSQQNHNNDLLLAEQIARGEYRRAVINILKSKSKLSSTRISRSEELVLKLIPTNHHDLIYCLFNFKPLTNALIRKICNSKNNISIILELCLHLLQHGHLAIVYKIATSYDIKSLSRYSKHAWHYFLQQLQELDSQQAIKAIKLVQNQLNLDTIVRYVKENNIHTAIAIWEKVIKKITPSSLKNSQNHIEKQLYHRLQRCLHLLLKHIFPKTCSKVLNVLLFTQKSHCLLGALQWSTYMSLYAKYTIEKHPSRVKDTWLQIGLQKHPLSQRALNNYLEIFKNIANYYPDILLSQPILIEILKPYLITDEHKESWSKLCLTIAEHALKKKALRLCAYWLVHSQVTLLDGSWFEHMPAICQHILNDDTYHLLFTKLIPKFTTTDHQLWLKIWSIVSTKPVRIHAEATYVAWMSLNSPSAIDSLKNKSLAITALALSDSPLFLPFINSEQDIASTRTSIDTCIDEPLIKIKIYSKILELTCHHATDKTNEEIGLLLFSHIQDSQLSEMEKVFYYIQNFNSCLNNKKWSVTTAIYNAVIKNSSIFTQFCDQLILTSKSWPNEPYLTPILLEIATKSIHPNICSNSAVELYSWLISLPLPTIKEDLATPGDVVALAILAIHPTVHQKTSLILTQQLIARNVHHLLDDKLLEHFNKLFKKPESYISLLAARFVNIFFTKSRKKKSNDSWKDTALKLFSKYFQEALLGLNSDICVQNIITILTYVLTYRNDYLLFENYYTRLSKFLIKHEKTTRVCFYGQVFDNLISHTLEKPQLRLAQTQFMYISLHSNLSNYFPESKEPVHNLSKLKEQIHRFYFHLYAADDCLDFFNSYLVPIQKVINEKFSNLSDSPITDNLLIWNYYVSEGRNFGDIKSEKAKDANKVPTDEAQQTIKDTIDLLCKNAHLHRLAVNCLSNTLDCMGNTLKPEFVFSIYIKLLETIPTNDPILRLNSSQYLIHALCHQQPFYINCTDSNLPQAIQLHKKTLEQLVENTTDYWHTLPSEKKSSIWDHFNLVFIYLHKLFKGKPFQEQKTDFITLARQVLTTVSSHFPLINSNDLVQQLLFDSSPSPAVPSQPTNATSWVPHSSIDNLSAEFDIAIINCHTAHIQRFLNYFILFPNYQNDLSLINLAMTGIINLYIYQKNKHFFLYYFSCFLNHASHSSETRNIEIDTDKITNIQKVIETYWDNNRELCLYLIFIEKTNLLTNLQTQQVNTALQLLRSTIKQMWNKVSQPENEIALLMAYGRIAGSTIIYRDEDAKKTHLKALEDPSFSHIKSAVLKYPKAYFYFSLLTQTVQDTPRDFDLNDLHSMFLHSINSEHSYDQWQDFDIKFTVFHFYLENLTTTAFTNTEADTEYRNELTVQMINLIQKFLIQLCQCRDEEASQATQLLLILIFHKRFLRNTEYQTVIHDLHLRSIEYLTSLSSTPSSFSQASHYAKAISELFITILASLKSSWEAQDYASDHDVYFYRLQQISSITVLFQTDLYKAILNQPSITNYFLNSIPASFTLPKSEQHIPDNLAKMWKANLHQLSNNKTSKEAVFYIQNDATTLEKILSLFTNAEPL